MDPQNTLHSAVQNGFVQLACLDCGDDLLVILAVG